MKNFMWLLLTTLITSNAFALISTDQKFLLNNKMGKVGQDVQLGTLIQNAEGISAGQVLESNLEVPTGAGLYVPRVARVVWDPSGVSGDRTVGAHASAVTIPANAVIRQVWFFTKTSLVSTGNNGTIAVSCNSANDIFSAADIDASTGVAGQIGTGVEVGTAATMLKVTTACAVTFTVATNAFTAGKMDWFIEYVIAE